MLKMLVQAAFRPIQECFTLADQSYMCAENEGLGQSIALSL